jgi:hypothetical protein
VGAVDHPTLEHRVRELVLRKAAKLAPHASAGRTRVLLLESLDLVNMSQTRMLDALRAAFGGMPAGVDQLWFVDSGGGLAPLFIDFTAALAGSDTAA